MTSRTVYFKSGFVRTQFFDRVEAQSSFPNTIRIINLIVYILIIIHWNACFFIVLSAWIGFGSDEFVYYSIDPVRYPVNATFSRMYLYAFFWSTLAMTTIADLPLPITDAEYAFIIVDFMLGVFIFATIVGKVCRPLRCEERCVLVNFEKLLRELQITNISSTMCTN